MSILEAIILGIVQGLTEFLPVSSSGHLELGKEILGIHPKDPLLFSIVVHGATAISTIIVLNKSIIQLIQGVLKGRKLELQYAMMIVISMIPVGIVGLLFESELQTFFEGKIAFVGFMLILTAGLLFFSEKVHSKEGGVSLPKALIIGLAQMVAILPGISRSGATISTALMLGVNKEEAARFSFLMVLPPILGALLLKIKDYTEANAAGEAMELGIDVLSAGFIAALIAGMFACKWMIAIVKKSKLSYFALYCLIVGLIAITYTMLK